MGGRGRGWEKEMKIAVNYNNTTGDRIQSTGFTARNEEKTVQMLTMVCRCNYRELRGFCYMGSQTS